jgi:hypothetical protein
MAAAPVPDHDRPRERKMMRNKLALFALACVAWAGTADAMDVATYLGKVEALRARGMAAMFSSEAQLLQSEIGTSGAALKRERLATLKAGRRPAYCPPDHASLSQQEIFAALTAVPTARRARTQVKDALKAAFVRKYPCR